MQQGDLHRITGLEALKVFTRPLRIRLYRVLHADSTATASQLAQRIGEAVSLVSYHVHQPAAHGRIVEAPDEGTDGRERWWRLPTEHRVAFVNSRPTADEFQEPAPELAALIRSWGKWRARDSCRR